MKRLGVATLILLGTIPAISGIGVAGIRTISWSPVTTYTDGTPIEPGMIVAYDVLWTEDPALGPASLRPVALSVSGTSLMFDPDSLGIPRGRTVYFTAETVLGTGESSSPCPPYAWRAPGSSASERFDVDGDGKADLTIWRPSRGEWWIKNLQDGSTVQVVLGSPTDVPVLGDYDGDGKTDIAVWQPATGIWYFRQSSDNAVKAIQWGDGTDIPVPGDYDGDGKTDIAVWRPGNGTWYILQSSDNYDPAKYKSHQWGQGSASDVPVPGDYDGDGKTDIAVWRWKTGTWYILQSSDGYDPAKYRSHEWGQGSWNDMPVPGDYDGDGKTDIAVWRPGDGTWYILQSSDGYDPAKYRSHEWGRGSASDVPVPGDYDGDGITDIAVWRKDTGTWYILQSSDGYDPAKSKSQEWGSGALDDVPIKSRY